MVFVNVDAPGNAVNRAGVRAIQKRHGADDRKAAAQARRDARAARRANGPNVILLSLFPQGGVNIADPPGAYVQGGVGFKDGAYQIVVVGPMKGTVEDYGAALAAWIRRPVTVRSSEPLDPPREPEFREDYERGGFLSIMLEPAS